VLADACDDGMPENLRYFDVREVAMGGQRVLITRTGWTAELGFEIYTRPDLDTDRLWSHVTAAGARHGMVDIGLDPMDIRRIEGAILNNGSDMDATMTPFAAGLGSFVDMAKGSFFGRAALERADRRNRLYGLACKAAEPLIGGPVARKGRQIGAITASGWSPYLEQGVAFVRLDSADDLEPRAVEVMGFDLAMHKAEIVDLPFYDPDKRIPRGLDAPKV
jgi:aminomethyltransferase